MVADVLQRMRLFMLLIRDHNENRLPVKQPAIDRAAAASRRALTLPAAEFLSLLTNLLPSKLKCLSHFMCGCNAIVYLVNSRISNQTTVLWQSLEG